MRLQRWQNGPRFTAFSLHTSDMRDEIINFFLAFQPFLYRIPESGKLLKAEVSHQLMNPYIMDVRITFQLHKVLGDIPEHRARQDRDEQSPIEIKANMTAI